MRRPRPALGRGAIGKNKWLTTRLTGLIFLYKRYRVQTHVIPNLQAIIFIILFKLHKEKKQKQKEETKRERLG
jgi:hypothetical protein